MRYKIIYTSREHVEGRIYSPLISFLEATSLLSKGNSIHSLSCSTSVSLSLPLFLSPFFLSNFFLLLLCVSLCYTFISCLHPPPPLFLSFFLSSRLLSPPSPYPPLTPVFKFQECGLSDRRRDQGAR